MSPEALARALYRHVLTACADTDPDTLWRAVGAFGLLHVGTAGIVTIEAHVDRGADICEAALVPGVRVTISRADGTAQDLRLWHEGPDLYCRSATR